MTVINTTRDFTTVGQNMVEAALFPPLAPYNSFPDSNFAAGQRFKGRRTFALQGGTRQYPYILWWLNDGPDQTDYAVQSERIEIIVTVMVAHYDKDDSVALARVTRDVGLIKEVCKGQLKVGSALPSGPFYIRDTSVVPASFGTVLDVEDVEFIRVAPEQAPVEVFGPGVVVGGCGVVIPLLVDAN